MNESELRKLIGERIAQRRSALGYTLTKMASETGISRQAIMKIECGESSVTAWRLVKIADALGRSVNWFVS